MIDVIDKKTNVPQCNCEEIIWLSLCFKRLELYYISVF